jgi:hypothetical protein
MPVFISLRARTNLLLLSLIPNALWNCWIVFIQAPSSPYWARWSSERKDALSTFGVGVAASSIVSGLFIWRRKALVRG